MTWLRTRSMDLKRSLDRSRNHEGAGIWSIENLRKAWRRVRANGGGPGVDQMTIEQFEKELEANLASLQRQLVRGEYRPQPVKRVLVPKPQGGLRPLAILTLHDRIVQRVVHDRIAPVFEARFLDCSCGFRPGRSVQDAVNRVITYRDQGCRWVLDADIKDCFQRIDHRLLMRFVSAEVKDRQLLSLIEQWLKARIFNELGGREALAVGTAQGAVLSPLLANVYLDRFDRAMVKGGYRLVRYADDLLVLARSKEEAQRALDATARALDPLRLNLNPYKTKITHFDEGFLFLGVFFLRNEHFYL